MTETVWTIGALLRWTAEYLASRRIESPRLDAEVLLSHTLGCRRIELYTRSEELASDDVRARFRESIRRRIEGCPVAYLVGTREFYLRAFEVSPAVLIPRPDTEMLVMAAIERLKPLPQPRVLDVGTGSGCVAVSLAALLPSSRIVAADISPAALEIASRNASRHAVSDRIEFRHGDLFATLNGEMFDAIVSNPPYIPSADIANLAADVRDHEPRVALDGGADGLDVIRRLIAESPAYLSSGGWLMFEIGMGQGPSVMDLFAGTDGFRPDKIVPDSAAIPRVAIARRV